jgi:hypothetical protein
MHTTLRASAPRCWLHQQLVEGRLQDKRNELCISGGAEPVDEFRARPRMLVSTLCAHKARGTDRVTAKRV